MNDNILIYRHDDADGLWSAAIVYNYIKDRGWATDTIVDVPVNYNKDSWDADSVNKADYVFVLDFTFDDMDKLVEVAGNKLVWIDHHKTAMEKFPDLWNSDIKGIRSLDDAGCGLTWKYFYPHRTMSNAVKYIADRDMWKFKYEETKPFCEAAYVKIKTIDNVDFITFFNSQDDGIEYACINEYIEFGKARLEEQALRVKNAFNRGSDFTFHGYKARLINTTSDISDIGQYVYIKSEYDIAVTWYVDGNNIKFSLRSNSKDKDAPDCAKIAQKYAGGGHYNAAGFSFMNVDISKLLFVIGV